MPQAVQPVKRLLRPAKRVYAAVEKGLYARGVLSAGELPLPDFLGIGSAQSGTTWLHRNLGHHPDIFLPSVKEVHYFDRAFWWPLREYSEFFAPGVGRLKGEITPGYAILHPDRIRFIRAVMPEARLVIIIRNPVDRAWSAARRVLSGLAESTFDVAFEDIEKSEIIAYLNQEHDYRPERGNQGAYAPGVLRGNYTAILDNWLTHFPEEQLLVCFFEELREDPRGLFLRVLEHIGASTDVDLGAFPLAKVVNKNPEHPIPDAIRSFLQDKYRDEIEGLYQRFGDPVAPWRF